MKQMFSVSLLSMGMSLGASAAIIYSQTFDSGFQNGGVIPDGSLNGWSDTRIVTDADLTPITDLQVTLNISGGYNGDLYAYLTHGNGFSVLLNRVGVGQTQGDAFGYADSGMTITLATSGVYENIHWYGGKGMPTGTYLPDGRAIDPLSPPAAFDTASTTANFDSMVGLDPNGSWTLFVGDVSSGGGQSMVSSWGLQLVAVPEPSNTAFVFGLGVLGVRVGWRICSWARRAFHS